MATKNTLTGGGFQDALGNVVASGYMLFVLSQDAQVNGNTQIAAGHTVKITLDSSGNVVAGQQIWPNDVLTPAGTFYNVAVYSAVGQLVWGPNAQQVASSPSPFNVGTWIPASVNISGGGGGGGTGTVTNFSFTNANGITGSVTSPTTTPNLTLALGAITPSSVSINGSQAFNGAQGIGTKVLSFTGSTGNSQVLGTDTNGTAIITGIGTGSLVTTIGNNVFVGHNQFTQDVLIDVITPATSIANQNSPSLIFSANYWNGGASSSDTWTVRNVMGAGTNPTSTLTFSHSGTPGLNGVVIQGLGLSGPNGNFVIDLSVPIRGTSIDLGSTDNPDPTSPGNVLFWTMGSDTLHFGKPSTAPAYTGFYNNTNALLLVNDAALPTLIDSTGITFNGNSVLIANATPSASVTPSDLSVPVTIGGTTYYARLSSTP